MTGPDPSVQDAVFISKVDHAYEASWQGRSAVIDSFMGTKAAAVAWAKERPPRVWLYSDDHDAVVQIEP